MVPICAAIEAELAGMSADEKKEFLKEMGLGNVAAQDSLKISRGSMPEETHVVVLNYSRS